MNLQRTILKLVKTTFLFKSLALDSFRINNPRIVWGSPYSQTQYVDVVILVGTRPTPTSLKSDPPFPSVTIMDTEILVYVIVPDIR